MTRPRGKNPPPHPATVVQPKSPFGAVGARPPHPATVVQPRTRFGAVGARSPHAAAATPVVQAMKRRRVTPGSTGPADQGEKEVPERAPKRANTEDTDEVEEQAPGTTILIKQFPGYWGSFAGDCAVMLTPKSKWLIDLGSSQTVTRFGNREFRNQIRPDGLRSLNVLITHFHKDHVADGQVFRTLGNLGAQFYHGTTSSADTAVRYRNLLHREVRKVVELQTARGAAAGSLYTLHEEAGAGYTLKIRVLIPEPPGGSTEENDYSLGALITIKMGADVFTFLTLGDMTPEAAATALNAVSAKLPNGKVSLLKYPHHGSFDNYHRAYKDMVGAETRVFISGSTGRDVRRSINKLNARSILSLVHQTTVTNYRAELATQIDEDRGIFLVSQPGNATIDPGAQTVTYSASWNWS